MKKCPAFPIFGLLGKKWTLHIIKELTYNGIKRYSELKNALEGISPKTLTERLRELEEEGIINRTYHNEIPPRVTYELSEKGSELSTGIESICEWVRKWYPGFDEDNDPDHLPR